jgi:hypothetical protein
VTTADAIAATPAAPAPAVAAARLRTVAWLAVLAGLVALVRWPFRDVIGEDEAFFLVVGHQWTLGVAPYVGSYDVKPPGLFALVAMAERLFGYGPAAIKWLEAGAVWTTASVIFAFGRRHIATGAGLIGAGFYVVASLDLGGASFPAELIASALASAGMLAGWSAVRGAKSSAIGCAVAGLLLGAAMTVKQPAVFEAAALVLATFVAAPARRWRLCAVEVAAMAAAPLGLAAFYALSGHFDVFLADAVFGAAGRTRGDNLGWGDAVLRLAPTLKPVAPLLALGLLTWAQRRRLRDLTAFPSLRFLALWLAGACAGVLAAKAMYDHYYLTLLPPLALLAGCFIERLPISLTDVRWRAGLRGVLIVATVAYLLASPWPLLATAPGEVAAAQQIAAQARALGQRPEDRMLVVNRRLAVYLFAGAEPSAAIFHPMQLLCPFPQFGARDPLTAAFVARPAFVVLADPAINMVCELPQRRQELSAFLARDYCAVGQSAAFGSSGAPDRLTLFVRRDRAGAACRADIPPPALGA